jgi:GAF domain-containing protein
VAALPAYQEGDPQLVEAVELGGIRTSLGVPMLKENSLIGALLVYRQEARPFTDKQIALLQNFAAQAVIAMENARLLKELRDRTEQVEAQSQELVKLNTQLEQRVADQVGEIERMSRGGTQKHQNAVADPARLPPLTYFLVVKFLHFC